MTHLISICLLVSLLMVSGLTLATDQIKSPAATLTSPSQVSRIAPPLASLVKQFKHDPAAEAEIIARHTHISIDGNYFSHSISYVAIYINSDEAVRDYSQISVGFNSFYEDIALEFANVQTPEGTLDTIKADATQIQSPTDENFYHDHKELLFSLPNIRKGSIIEFQFRYTETKKIIPGQWFDSFSMNWWEGRAAGQGSRSDAIAYTELSITAPKQFEFFSSDMTGVGIQKTRQEKGDKQVITWKGKNIPKTELQENMPRSERNSTLLRVSTASSWQTIARWANELATPHIVSDANLDKMIAEIHKKAATPAAKVKAVYQTLQEKVRYVFAHVGRGGYEPHNAAEVLTNGYGDCKDQTILAVTMLRKLGLKADPALVVTRARGIPDMSVTSVSFDHMIVHIPEQNGQAEMWMDTSGDKGLFPGFSVGIEGQPSLIVNQDTQSIVTIPSLSSEAHLAHLELAFDQFDGKNMSANFQLNLAGEFEQRLRGMWQYSRERDKSFRELAGRIYSNAEATDIKGSNADDLWQTFNLSGKLQFTNAWNGGKESLSYGFNIVQMTNLFTNFRTLHKPQDRLQDYENSPGYTLSTRITFTRPSQNHLVNIISQGQNLETPYYSLEQSGHESNGNYVVDSKLIIKPFRISSKEYADFYKQIQKLLDATDWNLSFIFDKNTADLVALEKAAGTGSVDNLIALAKFQIKNGNYENALETAIKATKADPKKAEAHYLLGLAQGYTNKLLESEKSFAKAEELGFKI